MTLGFTLADSRPQTVPNSDFLTSLSVRPIDEKIELKGLVVNFGPRSGEHLAQRQKCRASADKSPRGFCIGGRQKESYSCRRVSTVAMGAHGSPVCRPHGWLAVRHIFIYHGGPE